MELRAKAKNRYLLLSNRIFLQSLLRLKKKRSSSRVKNKFRNHLNLYFKTFKTYLFINYPRLMCSRIWKQTIRPSVIWFPRLWRKLLWKCLLRKVFSNVTRLKTVKAMNLCKSSFLLFSAEKVKGSWRGRCLIKSWLSVLFKEFWTSGLKCLQHGLSITLEEVFIIYAIIKQLCKSEER